MLQQLSHHRCTCQGYPCTASSWVPGYLQQACPAHHVHSTSIVWLHKNMWLLTGQSLDDRSRVSMACSNLLQQDGPVLPAAVQLSPSMRLVYIANVLSVFMLSSYACRNPKQALAQYRFASVHMYPN
jgi:hypothetical protein